MKRISRLLACIKGLLIRRKSYRETVLSQKPVRFYGLGSNSGNEGDQ